MLYMHEVHTVQGAREKDFEAAYREGWMEALAEGGEARLLWFLRQAHGTGLAYTFVTVTAVKDAAAWGVLAERVRSGDLQVWSAEVDSMRHFTRAKLLVPVSWSPLQETDLSSVPTDGAEHEPGVYMEDTAWPYPGGLSAYLGKAGSLYLQKTLGRSTILSMQAAFQPLFGTHQTTEVILWQRVLSDDALITLLTHETPPDKMSPGTWMHDALEVRDRWESRLLRSAPWSPLV